jgi:cytochrome c oxidase subunit 2
MNGKLVDADFETVFIDSDGTIHAIRPIRAGELRNTFSPRYAMYALVLPVGTTVRVLIAGTDVIHSFMVPSLGLQTYSMPGRLNETWVKIDHPGVYYGQCNQICGTNHAYMPIAIEGVSKEAFKAWVEEAKKKFASDAPATNLAAAAR